MCAPIIEAVRRCQAGAVEAWLSSRCDMNQTAGEKNTQSRNISNLGYFSFVKSASSLK